MATFKKPDSEQMPSRPGGERRARGPLFTDLGALGLKHVGGFIREEYLRELQGPVGMKTIREMTDNDPTVGAILFAVEQAIRQVDWKLIPADQSDDARKYANFVDSCRLDMAQTWSDVITEALSFLPFGWSMLEVTYKVRRAFNADPRLSSRYDDGLIGWRRMAPRAQESLRRWIYDPVDKDRLLAMQQFTVERGMVDIPVNRCLHFKTKALKDNPEGRSILRNVYRPWYLKKRLEEIEGIGIERDMAGLPVLISPEGLDLWNTNNPDSVAARKAAETIVRNIRVDEQMGVLLPFGWELKLLATGGKRAINTTDIINRYDQRIAMVALADFILLGHSNRLGSFALAKSKTSMFAMSLVGYLNVLRDVFNSQELPRLWRINGFDPALMPRLDYTPVDTPSLKDLASYVTALSSVGVDFSPAELQRYLLQLSGVPADLSDLAGRGGTGEGGSYEQEEDVVDLTDDEDEETEDTNEQPPNVAGRRAAGGGATARAAATKRPAPRGRRFVRRPVAA